MSALVRISNSSRTFTALPNCATTKLCTGKYDLVPHGSKTWWQFQMKRAGVFKIAGIWNGSAGQRL